MQPQVNPQLYKLFGVEDYAKELQAKGKQQELEKLNQALYKFILLKGIEDLSKEGLKEMEKIEFKDGYELNKFFVKHIDSFQDKLNSYGREFKLKILYR